MWNIQIETSNKKVQEGIVVYNYCAVLPVTLVLNMHVCNSSEHDRNTSQFCRRCLTRKYASNFHTFSYYYYVYDFHHVGEFHPLLPFFYLRQFVPPPERVWLSQLQAHNTVVPTLPPQNKHKEENWGRRVGFQLCNDFTRANSLTITLKSDLRVHSPRTTGLIMECK